MRRLLSASRLFFVGVLWALAVPPAAADDTNCSRVVAIGDLHGGYQALVSILRETSLLDEELRWIGEDACLVQTGDIVDRGERSREILDLLMRLSAEMPTRVHALLGNHEVMNLVGDLRYVSAAEFAAFAPEETAEERERGYRSFREAHPERDAEDPGTRAAFDAAYPLGWFAHRRAFSPEGRYGKWLLTRHVLRKLGTTLFVHGGLGSADAALGVDELDRRVRAELTDYLALRDTLVRDGLLPELTPFAEAFFVVRQRLEQEEGGGAAPETLAAARRFVALADNRFSSPDGPLWNRDLALADEATYAPELAETLNAVGAERIVVGHSTRRDGRIGVRFDGRVFLIDTGAGPTYGGRPSALEIRGGTVVARYLGEEEILFAPPRSSDAEIERFLMEGRVVTMDELKVGVTKPSKVVLELDGKRRNAAFKTVDIHERGVTRFEGRPAEMNFTDSFRYDRAAYLLDRHLGLEMVPVVVLRWIGAKEGALVDWIENAVDEEKRRQAGIEPPDPSTLSRQKATMMVFDALIGNTDRNAGNQLLTTSDWKLHLIDHTRGFRLSNRLPEKYEKLTRRLSRPLYERLLALDEASLVELLRDVLSRSQVKAVLERRDRIVDKVERDRKEHGDAAVFFD